MPSLRVGNTKHIDNVLEETLAHMNVQTFFVFKLKVTLAAVYFQTGSPLSRDLIWFSHFFSVFRIFRIYLGNFNFFFSSFRSFP